MEGFLRCPMPTSRRWSRRAGGGCVTRRCAATAATSTARPTSPATRRDREVFEAVAKILPRNAVWVCEQSDAHAPDRGSDLGRGLSEAGRHAVGSRLRRAASRPMAGHEPRRVHREPPARQQLVRRHQRARARRRKFHGPLQSHQGRGRAPHHRACGQRRDRGRPWRHHQGRDRARARRPGGEGALLRHRQLLGHAARSFRERGARTGGCRWSTSSPGSRTTRTPRCISRPDRKSRSLREAVRPRTRWTRR